MFYKSYFLFIFICHNPLKSIWTEGDYDFKVRIKTDNFYFLNWNF